MSEDYVWREMLEDAGGLLENPLLHAVPKADDNDS